MALCLWNKGFEEHLAQSDSLEMIGELLVCKVGYFRWCIGLLPGASISWNKLIYFAFSQYCLT